MLNGLGVETGIDIDAILTAGDFISRALGKPNGSRVGRALLAKAA
ncbi:isopropylmalate/homocitrate/citramalate synthase [Paraburkholderia sp. Cpub6]|nr:isopropylmalate/homocitrate/citramalate synthase [Paraburkholderia sp. Cpub6]